jgi:hypothetical protein
MLSQSPPQTLLLVMLSQKGQMTLTILQVMAPGMLISDCLIPMILRSIQLYIALALVTNLKVSTPFFRGHPVPGMTPVQLILFMVQFLSISKKRFRMPVAALKRK